MITLRPGECGSQGAVKLSYALVIETGPGHFSVKVLQIPQSHCILYFSQPCYGLFLTNP